MSAVFVKDRVFWPFRKTVHVLSFCSSVSDLLADQYITISDNDLETKWLSGQLNSVNLTDKQDMPRCLKPNSALRMHFQIYQNLTQTLPSACDNGYRYIYNIWKRLICKVRPASQST